MDTPTTDNPDTPRDRAALLARLEELADLLVLDGVVQASTREERNGRPSPLTGADGRRR